MTFPIFLILDLLCILISLPLLFTGRVRWARLAALLPLGFGILSGIIGLIGHATQFPAWRLIVVLIFAAAITSLICVLTARLLLGFGPKPPAQAR
jgi:hypothetical protein